MHRETLIRIVPLAKDHDGTQIGFVRIVSDRHMVAYVADVCVLEGHRGRGLGMEMTRFALHDGPLTHIHPDRSALE